MKWVNIKLEGKDQSGYGVRYELKNKVNLFYRRWGK